MEDIIGAKNVSHEYRRPHPNGKAEIRELAAEIQCTQPDQANPTGARPGSARTEAPGQGARGGEQTPGFRNIASDQAGKSSM